MKIDGRKIADKILLQLKAKVEKLKKKSINPHLAIVFVNKDPASLTYVNQKKLKGEGIGAKINIINFSQNTAESEILKTIEQLNNDNNVHGIIVQQPLPKNISNNVYLSVSPNKDADGFLPNSKFQPPITLAILKILEQIFTRSHLAISQGETLITWLKSQNIVVIGKGQTGGKPIINSLNKKGVNPTIIDSKTPNPKKITQNADIIISAVGK